MLNKVKIAYSIISRSPPHNKGIDSNLISEFDEKKKDIVILFLMMIHNLSFRFRHGCVLWSGIGLDLCVIFCVKILKRF